MLSAVFHLLCCPVCKHDHVRLQEDSSPTMGFASLFILKCKNQKCKFFRKFYSSSKIEGSQAFNVNRRIVVATRNIGIGHQAVAKLLVSWTCPIQRTKILTETMLLLWGVEKSAEHSKRRRQIRNFKKGYTESLEALEGPHYAAGPFQDLTLIRIVLLIFYTHFS